MRPLFLHYEHDRKTYAIQDAYLYGPELLVAPVWHAAQETRAVYLPAGAGWVHVWSGVEYAGGEEVTVTSPIGEPPVFYRKGAAFAESFKALKDIREI